MLTQDQYDELSKVKAFKFHSYYKYRFAFRGNVGGIDYDVFTSGDRDDIYRFEVVANKLYSIDEIECPVRIFEGDEKIWDESY